MFDREKEIGLEDEDKFADLEVREREWRARYERDQLFRDEVAKDPKKRSLVPGKQSLVEQSYGQLGQTGTLPAIMVFEHLRARGVDEVFQSVAEATAGRPVPPALATQPQTMFRVAERRAATLYRQAEASGEVDAHDPIVEEALARVGSGAVLPTTVKKQMERELGISLDRVRIHTDALAADAAHAVEARAFTVGEDIFFASGAFAPDSTSGKKLLAHELAHVIQGWQGRTSTQANERRVSQASDSLEHEADVIAERVVERSAQRATTPHKTPAAHAAQQVERVARGSQPKISTPATLAQPPMATAQPARGAGVHMLRKAEPAAAPGTKGAGGDKHGKSTMPIIKVSHNGAPHSAARVANKLKTDTAGATATFAQRAKATGEAAKSKLHDGVANVAHHDHGKTAAGAAKKQHLDAKAHQDKQHADAKKHHQAAKKPHGDTKAAKVAAGGTTNSHSPIQLKPISDWDKYMPPVLPDQDERERKHILGLVKKRINGERAASQKMLANLHAANIKQANAIRGMQPGLEAQIAAGQASALGQVAGSESSNVAAVSGAIAAAKGAVASKAAATKAQITSAHATLITQLTATMTGAIKKLTDASHKAATDITTAETNQVTTVQNAFTDCENKIRAYGGKKAGEASALGDSISLPYDGDKLEAAQKAAKKTAGEYADQMPVQADKAATDLGTHEAPAEADVHTIASHQQEAITTQFTNAMTAIKAVNTQAVAAADAAKTQSIAAITSAAASATASLSSLGASQESAIHQAATTARAGINAGASAAKAQTAASIAKIATGLEGGAAGIAKGAKHIEAPNPGETHKQVTEGTKHLAKAGHDIASGLNKSATGAVDGLKQQATQAAAGMAATAAKAKQTAAQMDQGAEQSMTGIATGAATQLKAIGDAAKTSTDQQTDAATKGFTETVKQTTETYKAATEKLKTGLDGAYESVKGSFDGAVPVQETKDINQAAQKAADAVKPWWQKALAIIAAVVVAVIVVVVVTALTGGLGTGLLATIAVGMLSGAAGSVAGAMASNLVLGNGVMDGITWKTVALGALGGGIAAGLTSGLAAGAGALAESGGVLSGSAEALTGALEGGAGLANFGMRFASNFAIDRVTDVSVQLITTGHYETSLESIVVALGTNAATSTTQFKSITEGGADHVKDFFGGGDGPHIDTPSTGGAGGGGGDSTAAAPTSSEPAARPGSDPATSTKPAGGDHPVAEPTTPGGGKPADPTSAKGGDPAAPSPKGPEGNTPAAPEGGAKPPEGSAPAPEGAKPPKTEPGAPSSEPTTKPAETPPAAPEPGAKPGTEPKPGETPPATEPKPSAPEKPAGPETKPTDAKGGDPAHADPAGPTSEAPKSEGGAAHDNATGSSEKAPDTAEPAKSPAEAAAETANEKLGYPEGTDAKAQQAADELRSGETPSADNLRDTEANADGRKTIEADKADPAKTPEERAALDKAIADQVSAKEEPTGNLKGDVEQAKAEAAAQAEANGGEVKGGEPEAGGKPPEAEVPKTAGQTLKDAWETWIHGDPHATGGPEGKEAAFFSAVDAVRERIHAASLGGEKVKEATGEALDEELAKADEDAKAATDALAANPSSEEAFVKAAEAVAKQQEVHEKAAKEKAETDEHIGKPFEEGKAESELLEPIQLKGNGRGVGEGAEAAVAAAAGSSGAPLPENLRRQFEVNSGVELSDVRVHVGPQSEQATSAVGARAYAVGQDIHFAAGQYDPSSKEGQLLIAHEVAHTVQQRGGSTKRQNKLEVSDASDHAEIEADRFAEAVVHNTGVAPTLSTSSGTVQRKAAKKRASAPPEQAKLVIQAAADIVQHGRAQLVAGCPPTYQPALSELLTAATGHRGKDTVSGADRIAALEHALASLDPVIANYDETAEGKSYLNDQFTTFVTRIRQSARATEAGERVDNSVRLGKDNVVELPDERHPREQAQILHSQLPKLIATLAMLNEQAIRFGHDAIHHQAAAMFEGHSHGKSGSGNLVELQNVLMGIDGILLLTDEEFQHHLAHVQGLANGVATYTEFVKAAIEIAGSCLGVAASFTAVLGRALGDKVAMTVGAGMARSVGLVLANVVAGIEIVHGIAVILDPHAEGQEKVDAGASVASGSAWFIGSRVGGAAVGAAASTAIIITYAELKLMADLYWSANVGITGGYLRMAFENLQRYGQSVATAADRLEKMAALKKSEHNPEKLGALQHLEDTTAIALGETVDQLIDDCKPHGYAAGSAKYPGSFPILIEAFAPLVTHKGARTPAAVNAAAITALERITWTLGHAGELVAATAKNKHLADVEAPEGEGKEGEGEGKEGEGKHGGHGDKPVQPKSGDPKTASAKAPAAARGGGGQALPADVRVKMERSLGADFSDVRIHQGGEASSVGALAYTQGSDIHFAPGQYDPASAKGQELLGHELTHVVQQRQGRVTAPGAEGAINQDGGLEAEADLMGAQAAGGGVARGGDVGASVASAQPIQMKPDPKAAPAVPPPVVAPAPTPTPGPVVGPTPTPMPNVAAPTPAVTPAPKGATPMPTAGPTVAPDAVAPSPKPAPTPTPGIAAIDGKIAALLEQRADPKAKADYAKGVGSVNALRLQALQYSFQKSGFGNTLFQTLVFPTEAVSDHWGQIYTTNAYRGGGFMDGLQATIEGLRGGLHILGDLAAIISAWAGMVAIVAGLIALIGSETGVLAVVGGIVAAIADSVSVMAALVKMLLDAVDALLGVLQMIILICRARASKDPGERARFAQLLHKEAGDLAANIVGITVQAAVMVATAGVGAGMSKGFSKMATKEFGHAFGEELGKLINPKIVFKGGMAGIAERLSLRKLPKGVSTKASGRIALQATDPELAGVLKLSVIRNAGRGKTTGARKIIDFTMKGRAAGGRLIRVNGALKKLVAMDFTNIPAASVAASALIVQSKAPTPGSLAGPGGGGGSLKVPEKGEGAVDKVMFWPSQLEAFGNAKAPLGGVIKRTEEQYENAKEQAGPALSAQVDAKLKEAAERARKTKEAGGAAKADAADGKQTSDKGADTAGKGKDAKAKADGSKDKLNAETAKVDSQGGKLQAPPPKDGILGAIYNQTVGRIGGWIGSAQNWIKNLVGTGAMWAAGFSKEDLDLAGIENDMRTDAQKDTTAGQQAGDAETAVDPVQQAVFELMKDKTTDEQAAIQGMAEARNFLEALEESDKQLEESMKGGQEYIDAVTPVLQHETETQTDGKAIDAAYIAPITSFADTFSAGLDGESVGTTAAAQANTQLAQMQATYDGLNIGPGQGKIAGFVQTYNTARALQVSQAKAGAAKIKDQMAAFVGTTDYAGASANAAALGQLATEFDEHDQKLEADLYMELNGVIQTYIDVIHKAEAEAPADDPTPAAAPPADGTPPPVNP